MDVPLQEVFSERQRYGRVARYELRPSRYGQAAPAANEFGEDQNNLRRVPDFPLVSKMSLNFFLGFIFFQNVIKVRTTLMLTPEACFLKVLKTFLVLESDF